MRRWVGLGTKIAVSVLLLYLVFRSVDLSAVATRLASVDPGWLIVGLLFLGAIIGISSVRWQAISAALGAALPMATHLKLNLISVFFNQALPSTLGGDAVRTWMARHTPAGLSGAAFAVLADRAAGFVALLLIVALGLPWSLAMIDDAAGRTAILSLLALGILAAGIYLTLGSMPPQWAGRWRLVGFLRDASRAGRRSVCRASPGVFALILSLLGHFSTILGIWALARSLGIDAGLLPITVLVPAVLLVSMIPITVAGWGVREGAMIAALAFAGIASTESLALSVLYGLAMIVWGLVGGLLWLLAGRSKPTVSGLAQAAGGGEGRQ